MDQSKSIMILLMSIVSIIIICSYTVEVDEYVAMNDVHEPQQEKQKQIVEVARSVVGNKQTYESKSNDTDAEDTNLIRYPGPEPLVVAENQNPTKEQLANIVDSWIDDLIFFDVTVEDMRTDADVSSVKGYDRIRFVDNRMLCMFRFKGNADKSDRRLEEVFDSTMYLTHCLNRMSKEYPGSDSSRLMVIPRMADLFRSNEALRRQLRNEGIHSGFVNSWVSSETIDSLGGSKQ